MVFIHTPILILGYQNPLALGRLSNGWFLNVEILPDFYSYRNRAYAISI